MSPDQAVLEKAASCGFVDPITGLPPRNEPSLSALLSIFHQQGRINWSAVQMRLPNCTPASELASDVIGHAGVLCADYPLFWESPEQLEARGDMKPDFIYLSHDKTVVALIENKIGAEDTHKGDSYGGQIGRYIQYMLESHVPDPYVILITSQFFLGKNPPWYATELQESVNIQQSDGKVKTRILVWEEILDSFS